MFEEVERAGIGPMQVVEQQHQQAAHGAAAQEPGGGMERPVAQLPGVAGDADDRRSSAEVEAKQLAEQRALLRAALAEGRPQRLLERDAHLVAGAAVADASRTKRSRIRP